MRGISRPAEKLAVSHVGLRSTELIGQEQIQNYIAVRNARNTAGVRSSKMGPKGCPETSVNKYKSKIRRIENNEASHHGNSRQSRKVWNKWIILLEEPTASIFKAK